jgi:predicted ATPase/class 3 adenylate cyclase
MNITEPLEEKSDQLVASFVPSFLRSLYVKNPGRKLGDPLHEDHAVILWIDVCNFSPLCSRLMKDPVSGVEKITGILNNHYDFLLKLITEYGGQTLFFAGDGLMSAWPGDIKTASESVQLAAVCAIKIIENRKTLNDKNELLSLHAILAMGPWQMAELEGIQGNRLVSFYGEVFSDLSLASKNKAPDHLLITNKALSFIGKELKSELVEYSTSILYDSPVKPNIRDVNSEDLSEEAVEKLKLYVPRTLTFPLNAEHLKWIGEIRPVTIVFVRLPNNGKDSASSLAQLRQSVDMARPLVQKYKGLLNQVWMDEKESNMLICFGPPPSAHIDNPLRSVRLGFEIHRLLKKAGIENSVGLSSGMAYCGILGNNTLRQFTVIGDVVNQSAHLAGIKRNEIFCDKDTYAVSNKLVNYGGQMNATVKGQKEPIAVFVPKSIMEDGMTESPISVSIGRHEELSVLDASFQNALKGASECVIIEGDSGMGKTRLLADFKMAITNENVLITSGLGDFVLRNTPYASLRPIVATLLGIGHADSEEIQTSMNENLIARFDGRASLLNIVLNTSIPEGEEIKILTGNQRVQATHDFLLNLFEDESAKQPIVLIMDDARWVDEFSWKLIESLKQNVTHSLIVISLQASEGFSQTGHLKDLGAQTIELKELDDQSIEQLICAKLGVTNISRDVASVVLGLAKGNPFFCLELTESLLDHEMLVFANNSCSLVNDAAMKGFSLPETVRAAIRSRIDRLGTGSQISLKVGSVVGTRFSERIICNIYPIAKERAMVPSFLQEVEQHGFLNEVTVDNLSGYHFNNATIVDVAYEMTLSEQRRQLHRESAEWYEKNFKDNLSPFYVRLAHHWTEANEKDKAATYFELEAIRLFRLGYAKEALDVGLEGVKLLGQDLPRDLPTISQKIGENMAAIGSLMERKTIESLAEHKKLNEPQKERVIKLLLSLGPFAHQCQQGELFALMIIICQRLTLEHGNGESAAEVYAMYAIIYKVLTHDSHGAFNWNTLALEVDRKNGLTLQSRVLFIYGWFIALWKLPFDELIPLSMKGADAGFNSGDIIYGCFNLSLAAVLKSTSGKPLDEVIQTATEHFVKNNNAVMNAAFHLILEEQVAKALQGRTTAYTSLTDEKYDEEKDIASICKTDLFNQIAYYFVSKLKLNVHFGNWDEAIGWGEKALPLLPAFANQPGHIELEQYYTMAALYKSKETVGEASANFKKIAESGIANMNSWALICPENFLHKALLLEGIQNGLEGRTAEGEQKFIHSAKQAHASGYTQDEGLAFEHLLRMKKRTGANYSRELESALDAYNRWGAQGKVRYLREQFNG